MIARRDTTIFDLDRRASSMMVPRAIITADCSNPKEIDDGIFVEPLPAAQETYRVGVCIADTSKLYADGAIRKSAFLATEARYGAQPSGERQYMPMIDPAAIRDQQLSEGNIRNALIVSFIVGDQQAPDQTEIAFRQVEVLKNLTYRQFSKEYCCTGDGQRYSRAATYILRHLKSGGEANGWQGPRADTEQRVVPAEEVVQPENLLSGSRVNSMYMIAANYLVGQLLATEGSLAIYRVHEPNNDAYSEFMPTNIARFSSTPGYHSGLGLGPYSPVTSPLRRLNDFMMNYRLKQRFLGRPLTDNDRRNIAATVERLNQHVVAGVERSVLRRGQINLLGREATSHNFMPVPEALSA